MNPTVKLIMDFWCGAHAGHAYGLAHTPTTHAESLRLEQTVIDCGLHNIWFNRDPLEWIIAPEGPDAQLKSEFGDLVLKVCSNARDLDKKVTFIQASAFYTPLVQHGSLISLIAARSLLEAPKPRCVSPDENKWIDMGISASKRHTKQLERFGRYPTRNALLGQKNTAAEEEFLKEYAPSLQ